MNEDPAVFLADFGETAVISRGTNTFNIRGILETTDALATVGETAVAGASATYFLTPNKIDIVQQGDTLAILERRKEWRVTITTAHDDKWTKIFLQPIFISRYSRAGVKRDK